MRTRTFALAALAAGLCLPAAAQPPKPDYKPFASSAGRYKVLFPGPVKTDTREVKTDTGTITITLDTVELPGEVTFLVTHLGYPAAAPKLEPAKRLDKVRDGNKGTDGKVLTEKDLTVGPDKHPAREVVIEKPSGVIRNRIVVAGTRLYQVMLQGPKDYVTGADADRFFDSFEVTR